MSIDKYSLTWKTVEKFIAEERMTAVELLIGDRDSEQQRGKIELLERLQRLALEEDGDSFDLREQFEFINH